jgi:tetratricopeptide (TPR) repeat protein
MKKSLLRATLVACLPFCAMAMTVAVIPANAAAAAAADAPHISRSIQKAVADCKKALDGHDYATALAKCTEAKNTADITDYDRYVVDRFLGVAYFQTNDRAHAGELFISVLRNPATPPDDFVTLVGPAMSLAADKNDHALVIDLGKLAIAHNAINNPDVYGTLANAYYVTNDFQNAVLYSNKGVELARTQGKIPQYGLYQILTFSYDKLHDRPNTVRGFEMMARDYGKADDWRYLLDFSLDALPRSNPTSAAIALLDLYRLRLIVNASWQPANYLEAADAAHGVRSWGDARTVLDRGIAEGVINRARVAPLVNQTNNDARRDEPILPTVERSAHDSKALANVAEAYYGYGRYADAVRVAQRAIDAGGPFAAEAKLVMALAQIKQGNEAAARLTLANFTGDAALTRAAALVNLYLSRPQPVAAPAPAPAPAH